MSEAGPTGAAQPLTEAWLTPGRFALVLGALVFAAFPQVLLGLETFVVRDFGFFAYPLAQYQRECFWRGELPLWNPYNNCGVPFLAQWNTMPLYPPALLYLVLPLSWSLGFFGLLHLFWAGLGMYYLAHRWTGSRLAGSVAGVLFAFNGFSLNLLMWPSHIATWSWMPWVILTVEQGWREGGRKLVLAALVGALQMLAGGPETILFTWLILSALWVLQLGESFARGKRPGPSSGTGGIFRFPVIVLLVAALAAAQLLPFLDLAAHSQRETGFADTRWSMPAWGWANFLVPLFYGSFSKLNLFFQYGQQWTSSYYLGVGALMLAGLALWSVRGRRVWLLVGAAVIGVVLAGGDQNFLSRWIRHLLPQLSMITYPVKFVALAIFAAPVLAAFGIARLAATGNEERRVFERRLGFIAVILFVLIGGILVWAWRRPFPTDDVGATLRNGAGRAAFLVLAVGALLALRRATAPAVQRCVPFALLLVFWLDVWTHEPPQNPTVPSSAYELNLARKYLAMNPQPTLGESRAMVAPAADVRFTQLALNDPKANYLAKRLGYFADCNLLDRVPKVNGFFSVYPRECGELNSALYLSTNACPEPLADFLAVSQMTTPGEYVKWSPRASCLPLVTAGQRPSFLDDTNALYTLLRTAFDPRRLVLLPPESRGRVSVTNQTQARVTLKRFESQRVEADVDAAERSLVVVAQTFYHCWRASIDGQPTPLLRANYAFQAVEVPPGKHQVRLDYRDRAFYAGAVISGLSLLGCLVVLWRLPARPGAPASSPAMLDERQDTGAPGEDVGEAGGSASSASLRSLRSLRLTPSVTPEPPSNP